MEKTSGNKLVKLMTSFLLGDTWTKIIDMCLEWLDFIDCEVKRILLLVDEKSLKERLANDIEKGVRLVDVAVRSIVRIPLYQVLNKYDKSFNLINT